MQKEAKPPLAGPREPPPEAPEDFDILAAVSGRCPRCRKGAVYQSLVQFRAGCPVCRLDLDQFNVGDGATVFLILILNIIGMVGILLLEFNLYPPVWVHLLIWPPLLLALTIVGLRAAKGLLLALEYRHDARQDVAGGSGDGR